MARRLRTPSPATLAALGLAGALGAAPQAHAQDVAEPALAATPVEPETELEPSTDPPVPPTPMAEVPVEAPAEPAAEPPAVPEPPAVAEPPAPVPAPEVPAAAPALPEVAEVQAGADVPGPPATGPAPAGHEEAPARRPRKRPERDAAERPAEADPPAPRRRRTATRQKPKAPGRTPVQATAPAPLLPTPLASTPTGGDPLVTAGSVQLSGALLERFRIPPFLLPIYQAAGTQYGIRWEVLAAINEIETDYGRNLNVSSAGAQGWMQFMPATWKAYGTDANKDGKRDPYNPVDAIFAAARYLKAAGAEQDLRKAIFAYNHADWYVESVLLRAKLIAEVPSALVDGLSGLTQGRFPVLGAANVDRVRPVARGGRTELQAVPRKGAILFTEPEAPVVAVQDGRVVKVGHSDRLGRHLVLEDAFGNRYTYARLSKIARTYPVPKSGAKADAASVDRVLPELGHLTEADAPEGKERLFANPARAAAAAAPATAAAAEPYSDHDRRLLGGLDRDAVDLRALRVGSEVIGGTVLGRAGSSPRTGRALVRFEVRPAGAHAPRLDPVPFLEGLRLVQRSGLDRRLKRQGQRSIGQVLLMGKDALVRRVLSNEKIVMQGCMREDVRSGVIDRRVLATLELLAASGLAPTVTSLRCNHGLLTSSGNVSHHSTGTAVDIGAINGTRIEPATQGPGSITERTVRRLLTLQGSMAPAQVISLMSFEGAPTTLSMPDHDDHIHVGWRPGGDGHPTARRTAAVGTLSAGQWRRVADRLTAIGNPTLR